MNIKRFLIPFFIISLIPVVAILLFKGCMNNLISSPDKMEGFASMMGLTNVPVFKSGTFSENGDYFAYTYTSEVEKPDVEGNITIRGIGSPTYFQVMQTATGKRMITEQYRTGKSEQLYVVWTEGNLAWLMESVYHKGNRLALYDMKANKFRFSFGELEKLNPNIDWKSTNLFFINTTEKKGLLLEANDKRYYRIDPNTGKAETISGKLEMVNYNYAKSFHVSDLNMDRQFIKKKINGSRKSITTNNGNTISEDDFIEVKFLTLTKNKQIGAYNDAPITFYKGHFFVLSPIESDNDVDMELTMLDENTLKTSWKLKLPQKKLKTMIPNYGFERFFIKGDRMLITNNDYLLTINLSNGKIIKEIKLFK